MIRLLRSALIAGFVAASCAGAAEAHARLLASNPAKDAAVSAPTTIHLEFSEGLEPKSSTATLMTMAGDDVPVTATVKGKVIDATPQQALAPGAYMVMWTIVSTDGHKMTGDYNFTVR
jgi:methionine-rich copper-binding protein CopC